MTRKPQPTNQAPDWAALWTRVEGIVARLECIMPVTTPQPDWRALAYRWRKSGRNAGYLQSITHPHRITLDNLQVIDEQKRLVDRNTRQFLAGLPANNVLLTGSRGTGKSSLVKAVLHKYARKGLRLIEVEKSDLVDLPDIAELVVARPARYIIFCDDLSFDANEPGYKALKVMLDGSIAAPSSNILIYATSNRRHLLPEYFAENLETKYVGEEVHPGESVEEKISLSERFGLWVSFYPFTQEDYLTAMRYWLSHFGVDSNAELDREALQWALSRGSRSGRVAWQFARDRAGRHGLKPARSR
jgi:uncharacterized protein